MFDSIRKHQRVLQFILLLLIFPAFVFFGVSGYDTFTSDDSVASVKGSKISRAEFDDAQRRQLDQLRQTLGSQLDAKMLDTPEARAELIEGLVAQRALVLEAQERGVHVSDARLREAIRSIPGLARPDGSFDMERYRSVLGAQGLSEQGFEMQMRRDLALQTLPEGASRSAIVPAAVLDRLIALQEQVREVRELRLPASDFAGRVSPTPEQLRKYYDEHARAFETPESAKVEYVVLSAEDIGKQVVLGADDVRSYYEQNKSRYTVPEQRRASHILIEVPADASADARKAARQKAEALLEKLRGGADFAALAREQSQDRGSAREGGDLGFFSRGDMVEPFSNAAWALKEGELSGVVESEFGYHLIKLTGIRAGQQRPFEQARGEIEAELRKQQAGKRYAEAAEQFSNLVYEQADTFEPVAKRFGLALRTAESLDRSGTMKPGAGAAADDGKLLSNAKLLGALFSPESIARKQNTEAVDVGGGTLVSARVIEHRPAQRKPFESVQAEVREHVVRAQAKALAAEAAKARLAELRGGAEPAGFGPARPVSRSAQTDLPPAALDALFRAPTDKLPAYVEVDLGEQGSAIYRLQKVVEPPAELIAQRRDAYRQQVEQMLAQQDLADYIASLKARSKIERHPERLGAAAERQ